ncbi:esterase/lipase family protein [Phormidesmis sp. 146-12]
MSNPGWSDPVRRPLPVILVRGFGGTDTVDERRLTYQGFNDGSVYPQKRGENYIYEGLILRFIKSDWRYHDATNVVGYYANQMTAPPVIPEALKVFDPSFFQGKVIIDPAMALKLLRSTDDPCHSLWVFRYYDLCDRRFSVYGEALVRLIEFIRALIAIKQECTPKVNIIAHSMGGLVVREAIQRAYPKRGALAADRAINKIVTLGTPHKGISFQLVREFRWLNLESSNEIEHFNPDNQKDPNNDAAYVNFSKHFPLDRLLCVVGTNYRSYASQGAAVLNRLFAAAGEDGLNYNRSDGLVKQFSAQIEGAPRTFLHKPHGGFDSLISARESFEVATRFFLGDVRSRLRQVSAQIKRGFDLFGKSEIFLGVSVKPRGVDFELFHQSKEAENCYGPFRSADFSEDASKLSFPWADDDRLIWEGFLNTGSSVTQTDLVMRLEFYVGERDLFGLGFSDNLVFSKQYYVRAILQPTLQLYLYTGEEFADGEDDLKSATPMRKVDGGWEFDIGGTGFSGTYRIEVDRIPEEGQPVRFV